jgi:hypothetical protein
MKKNVSVVIARRTACAAQRWQLSHAVGYMPTFLITCLIPKISIFSGLLAQAVGNRSTSPVVMCVIVADVRLPGYP